MNKDNERIFNEKFKQMFDNCSDDMPFYRDMNLDEKSSMPNFEINNKLKHKKHFTRKRITIIATAAAFLIVCSSVFGMAISNGSVDAIRTKIFDIIYSINGDDHKISDKATSIEINTLDDTSNLEKARDMMPELFIDETIFGKYGFESMIIEKISNNNISASSMYYNKEDVITIYQNIINQEDIQISTGEPFYEEKINGGDLIIINDLDGEVGLNQATYIKENYTIEIIGFVNINDLKSFMKSKITSR